MVGQKVYPELVLILEDYLGPRAEQFLERQVDSHLHKKPMQVSREDIAELATWIKLSLSLLTEDAGTVNHCEQQILKLSRS